MLRKYIPNPDHILNFDPINLFPNLTFIEEPLKILDRKTRQLRNKEIHLVKVLWKNHSPDEATWEREDEIQSKYHSLIELCAYINTTRELGTK